jgi:hypothetical protein
LRVKQIRWARAAGTGGEMAEFVLERAEEKTTKRARRDARGAGKKRSGAVAGAGAGNPGIERENAKEKPLRVEAEPENGEIETRQRGSGLKRLQKAADKRLKNASEELANLLLKKAQEGMVESTRMLVTLAEHLIERKPVEKKKKKKRVQPWITLLASEPPFRKPEVGDVWLGDGWKKPTGEYVNQYAQEGDDRWKVKKGGESAGI